MAVKIGQKRIDLWLLIKSVSLFLAGTNSRWEVIANYMNVYSTSGSQENCQRFHWQGKVSKNLAIIDKMAYLWREALNCQYLEVLKFLSAPSEQFENPRADFTSWQQKNRSFWDNLWKCIYWVVNTPKRWGKNSRSRIWHYKKDYQNDIWNLLRWWKQKKLLKNKWIQIELWNDIMTDCCLCI